MAQFNVGNRLGLKRDATFTRSFPMGGYKPDSDVAEYDKYRMQAGPQATVTEVHESAIPGANVWYLVQVEPGDRRVSLSLNGEQICHHFELVPGT